AVAVGDINGDGKADIVVANYTANSASVLLNTTPTAGSAATFAAPRTFATGSRPTAVILADINGDGRPDIITANYNSNTVSVLINSTTTGATTPSFVGQRTFGTGTKPQSVAAVDVNGDGSPDLVSANLGSNNVSVLLNTTSQSSTTATFTTQQ